MTPPRYCFGLEGSLHFIRSAAEAQGEVMEPFFDDGSWEYAPEFFQEIPALYRNQRPMALGGVELFGIVVCFIGTCFAKKIFDEVYERTLKRPIGAQLDKFFATAVIPVGKSIEYRDVIYLEDIDLVVVVRALAEPDATSSLQASVMQAHLVAHSYIEKNGRKASIHCHKVANGVVSLEPELFNTLEEIKQHDRNQVKMLPRR
jgi:hypothetical protein